MTEESISQKLSKVLDKTNELTIRLKKQLAYVNTLAENYKQNRFYSEDFEQGKNPPHEFWVGKQKGECYDSMNGQFPHLFHTFNPQLNNMTDMLSYLINECCCKEKEQQQQKDLENLDNKMNDFQKKNEEHHEKNHEKQEETCIKLDDIIRLLSKEKICITLEDLNHFLRGGRDRENQNQDKQLVPSNKGKEKTDESQHHLYPPKGLWSLEK